MAGSTWRAMVLVNEGLRHEARLGGKAVGALVSDIGRDTRCTAGNDDQALTGRSTGIPSWVTGRSAADAPAFDVSSRDDHGHRIAQPPSDIRSLSRAISVTYRRRCGVLHVEDVVERPVEVVGHVRHLLVDAVGGVRHDSPRRPPERSTAKRCWHCGQVTAARVWPFGVDPVVEVLQEGHVRGEHVLDDRRRHGRQLAEGDDTRASSTTVVKAGFSMTRAS